MSLMRRHRAVPNLFSGIALSFQTHAVEFADLRLKVLSLLLLARTTKPPLQQVTEKFYDTEKPTFFH